MKKILIYTLSIALAGNFASCKKWLDLKPQDGIVRDEFWKTKEQVESAVTGIYASMLGSTSSDRAMAEYFFIWGEARADMVTPGFRASQDEQDIVNLNILPTNNFTNWRSFYQTINYCNTVIELAPPVLENDNTFSQDQLNRAIGEALTIRSLLYFYLVRSFGDVPLKLTATTSDQQVTNIAKTSRDTILNQIVTDLKKAEPYLPFTYGNKNFDKGRATRYTVNALLADVYLWMDKYNECVAACDKIITSGNFGLVQEDDFFDKVFYEGNSNESIFELQFDAQKLNPFYGMHTPGNRRWGAAFHLTEDVYGIDLVNTEPQSDVRGDETSFRGTDFSIWKYMGADNSGDNFRTQDQSFAHWIFYRYADILLMKAEAINQLDQPLEASRIVKTIRERANALELKEMDSTNKSAMTDYILEERQREFAFEGKRWYDVLRNAKRNNYEGMDFLLNMAAISIPQDRLQAALNKLRDKNSHYFPIFTNEIQLNQLLEQNPFYK
ncbi:RagB/SusD family nutrient uptake outer membrane protein [Pseudoflavitalea sp. X16]|uniref:RagB/SusD family nutrient uptake outer membrane protein n=1 Tax=Paraflavitalea devenefica TaxID=2716334 RepID=UPI00141FDC61|nr:RagB/SusD family nutrient uptake outer membrane protein [Paraflavitalea devenefica]NII25258.1 RagB/SusD family nutrient uptake outer membrane protein [Paraflavitalea devenefica]